MINFGTKIYTVHIHPDWPDAYQKPVFVREGFNLWAFLFTFFWALYHRLWWVLFVLVVTQFTLMTLSHAHVVTEASAALILMGIQILVGCHANDWLRNKLKRQGYIFADIAVADSILRAQQRFFERHLALA